MLRVWAHFFLLGALLLVTERGAEALWDLEQHSLVVPVPPHADRAQLQRAVREALLLEEVIAAGVHRRDPVVRDRLIRNMGFAEPQAQRSDGASFDAAVALGMHTRDPVSRARLLDLSRTALMARTPQPEPTDAQLQQYFDAHPQRFGVPTSLSFRQRFVSEQIHGSQVEEVAARLLNHLSTGGPETGGGDATLLPERMHGSRTRIDGRFGPGFSDGLWGLPTGRWAGPIPSTFGLHAVWVEGRGKADSGALAHLDKAVRVHYRHDHRGAHLEDQINALRQRYRVEVRPLP